MRSIFMAIALFVSSLAFAGTTKVEGDKKTGDVWENPKVKYRSVSLELYDAAEVKLVLSIDYKTTDGCNSFSLHGDVRKIASPEGTTSFVSDLILDYGIMGTEMACNALPKPRSIPLSAETTLKEVRKGEGIRAQILVPDEMDLTVKIVK